MVAPLLWLTLALVSTGWLTHPRTPPGVKLLNPSWVPPPPWPQCVTALPANFCTCGNYALFMDDPPPLETS